MKYAIVTFGCRVNQAESLQIEEALRTRGCVAAPPGAADLVLVNTCSVTASADQGARQTIRRIARDNPSARIVVTGCYATRRPEEVSALPSVARVVANHAKEDLVGAIEGELGLTTAERFGEGDGPCGAALEPGVAGRTVFFLRVQTGCEEPCAYCIIPSTRGPGRSLPIASVLDRVARAAGAGFKETVIAGVHLGSYGRDLDPPATLLDLLRALGEAPHDMLIRVSSLEPMECTPEIIDLVAGGPRFAPHFHLPLQHGSDRMLRAMRRPYQAAAYWRLLDRIRECLPHAAIGSDLIVGFPGETDDDVAETVRGLRASPLTSLHVFPYSDRPGTAAAALGPKVPGHLVRERAIAVRAVGDELARRFRQAQVGLVRRGLTLEDGSLVLTDNYLKVRIAPPLRRNQWVRVRIAEAGEVMRGALV